MTSPESPTGPPRELGPLTEKSPPGTYLVATRSGTVYVVEITASSPPVIARYPQAGSLIHDSDPMPGVDRFSFDATSGHGEIGWWKDDPRDYDHPGIPYAGTIRTTSHVLTVRRHNSSDTIGDPPPQPGDTVDEAADSSATDGLVVWCEVCGREQRTTLAEAHENGWDFGGPGGVYPAGLITPRTCGTCSIDKTVWWQLAIRHIPMSALEVRQRAVIDRILAEYRLP